MFTFEQFPVYQKAEKLYAEVLGEIKQKKAPSYLIDQLKIFIEYCFEYC